MSPTDTDAGEMRSTPQEGLELDPQDHDSSANVDVATLGLKTSTLFQQALEQTRMAIAISDPHRPDCPMIYVNQAFLELTGYERDECVGRNCRFLQGAETDDAAVQMIRDALEGRTVEVVEILNYRKDGSKFWNALHVGPVYDDAGNLTHYYGSQWDVTDLVEKRTKLALQMEVAEELQHRTKNLFGVISSIINLSSRGVGEEARALADKIRARVTALGDAHSISISEGRNSGVASDLHDLVAKILTPYQEEGRERVILSGPIIQVPRNAVTPVGLMLHELATNAVKYGALSHSGGKVTIAWERVGDRLQLTWTEEGGPKVTEPEASGMGSRMMDAVLRTIGASIDYDWPPTGLSATLEMGLDPEGKSRAIYGAG